VSKYREIVGDLWVVPADWRTITTNGFTTRYGRAVMGRGVAYQAKCLHPELPALLGLKLEREGNVPHVFEAYRLVTLPVKPRFGPGNQPGFLAPAEPELIRESLLRLVRLPLDGTIVLPRPGCGAGRLSWDAVRPICDEILTDDRFVIVHQDDGDE